MKLRASFRRIGFAAVLAVFLGGSIFSLARAHESDISAAEALDPKVALARSQAAIGGLVGDYAFKDRKHRGVSLSDYRGKPLVVSLVFTACAESCPLLIDTLHRAVAEAREALGEETFQVITVGFDYDADTPERLSSFARQHGIDDSNWAFLSGDHAAIDGLVEDLGFLRVSSSRGFDHLAQVSILDAEGQVYHQVYGDDFTVQALVEPLKNLQFNALTELASLSDIVERVRLFCTFYDAREGRYAFDYSFFIALAISLASLLAVSVILLRAWLGNRRPPESPA